MRGDVPEIEDAPLPSGIWRNLAEYGSSPNKRLATVSKLNAPTRISKRRPGRGRALLVRGSYWPSAASNDTVVPRCNASSGATAIELRALPIDCDRGLGGTGTDVGDDATLLLLRHAFLGLAHGGARREQYSRCEQWS